MTGQEGYMTGQEGYMTDQKGYMTGQEGYITAIILLSLKRLDKILTFSTLNDVHYVKFV